jgi:hypothetical protein
MSIDLTPAKTAIRTAYAALQQKPSDWVRLAKLRPMAEQQMMDEGIDLCMVRGMFAKAVIEMERADEFIPAPDSNRKVLTEMDDLNAVTIGNRVLHLIAQQMD